MLYTPEQGIYFEGLRLIKQINIVSILNIFNISNILTIF